MARTNIVMSPRRVGAAHPGRVCGHVVWRGAATDRIGVLYWNEERASQALGQEAAALPRPQRKPVDPALDGRLVHVRGTLVAVTQARDPVFGVSQGGLLPLSPAVETC